jgi:hypothetical protein
MYDYNTKHDEWATKNGELFFIINYKSSVCLSNVILHLSIYSKMRLPFSLLDLNTNWVHGTLKLMEMQLVKLEMDGTICKFR